MASRTLRASAALIQQSQLAQEWLAELAEDEFGSPTSLPEWDIRTLTAHLVLVVRGLSNILRQPIDTKPIPVHQLVQRYRIEVDQISASTRDTAGARTGRELAADLAAAIDIVERELAQPGLPATVNTPRGPGTLADFLNTRVVEVVVHADDLNRSLPDRAPMKLERQPLAISCRTLAQILAAQNPGQTLEVRVPPFAAVQCGTGEGGPTHTRGTPPNVVETDPLTFIRLATGRTSWDVERQAGSVRASGLRADLTAMLPVLS